MNISFITLYPDQLSAFIRRGVLKRAIDSGQLTIHCIDLRSYANPPHYKVDDYPYSNRQGMLLKADILSKALNDHSAGDTTILMPDPKGRRFDWSDAKSLSLENDLVFLCPSFEGVDHRILDLFDIRLFSVGDVIVPTGDTPAVLMAESIIRYLPDVLGCSDCVENDSILSGLLEAPQYTSPRSIDDAHDVPDILLSGNHQAIDDWKLKKSVAQTMFSRPDLINQFNFSENLVTMVDQIIMEDLE